MRCIGRGLVIVGILLVVLAIVLAGTGIWFVRRPWPQVRGTVQVSGLSAPAEVIRDEWGVPHIYAENEHDLFFAQGYVHAQDRLWQMEFNRRIGSGTLSAVLGEATLETDLFLRTVGLRRAAERDWQRLDNESRAVLEAYAEGVNAYVEGHRDRLPLEFTILGIEPEPWTPVDTLSWAQVMSFQLGTKYDMEILRARLVAELGEQATQELMPPYPGAGPFIVPPEVQSYAWLRGPSSGKPNPLAAVFGEPGPMWGSNNWAVHGSRTTTGLPLLANDMHLSLNLPSIWYENGLHGGRFDTVGYSFPGAPAIVVGHNQHIAWGVTNLPADVQDLYIEKLDDSDQPTRYEFKGKWQELEIVEEIVEVKGSTPVELRVALTQHGPIVNNVIGSLKNAEPMAFRWTSLDGNNIYRAVLSLDLASNWEEFRQALRSWDAPCQNFVYADIEGNVGYQMPCNVPIRAPGHHSLRRAT
jgi:penicillin amidase